MRILHLVLYSDNKEDYVDMYKLMSPFYKQYENIGVKTYFYKFTDNLNVDFKLDGDLLHIKGSESYIPGILEKTIKAFEFFVNTEYDYVLRSNISTVINFDLLVHQLTLTPLKGFGGGRLHLLHYIDEASGVFDDTWFGTYFMSGTSMIFDKECFRHLVENKDKIRYNFIDDLAIGFFIKEHRSDLKLMPFHQMFFVEVRKDNDCIIPAIFYRNRCMGNRYNGSDADLKHMKITVDYLTNSRSQHHLISSSKRYI